MLIWTLEIALLTYRVLFYGKIIRVFLWCK